MPVALVVFFCVMKRRQVLEGVATGSVLTLGIGSVAASGRTETTVKSAKNLDEVHVAGADGRVVRTVEDPTETDLRRLRTEIDPDEQVVSPECTVKCKSDCGYTCCGYRCECKTCDDGSK